MSASFGVRVALSDKCDSVVFMFEMDGSVVYYANMPPGKALEIAGTIRDRANAILQIKEEVLN